MCVFFGMIHNQLYILALEQYMLAVKSYLLNRNIKKKSSSTLMEKGPEFCCCICFRFLVNSAKIDNCSIGNRNKKKGTQFNYLRAK